VAVVVVLTSDSKTVNPKQLAKHLATSFFGGVLIALPK
jgi:hypothetical protein